MYSCLHGGLRRGALGIFYLTILSFSDFCEPLRNFNPGNICSRFQATAKGQLISKCLFGVFNFIKKNERKLVDLRF